MNIPSKRSSSTSARTYTPTMSSSGPVVEEMLRNCYASGRAIRRAERDEIRRSSAALNEEMMRKAMASEDPDSSDLGIYEPSLDMTGYEFGKDRVDEERVAQDKLIDDKVATGGVADGGVGQGVAKQQASKLRSMRVSNGQGKGCKRIGGGSPEKWWITMR
jgi:hypothetical protein